MRDEPDAETENAEASQRLPTMKDVAARAGVSRQLVSMIMRELPGPADAARKRVLKAASELGFQPNESARRLRQSRTRLIGVMFSLHNALEARFVEAFLERARHEGFGVVLAPKTESRTTEVMLGELLGHRIEALVCWNPDPRAPTLDRVLDMMPVVWLGERTADPRASSVRADDDRGLRLAVEHLVALGHRSIAYFGGAGGAVGPDRARAYTAAMDAAGLADHIDQVTVGFDPEESAEAARSMLRRARLPSAIIACGDGSAAAIKAVLVQSGVSVPEEMSIVGYDDSRIAALSYNSLTSIRQDVDRTVDLTLTAITARLDESSDLAHVATTPATLVVRQSTGVARALDIAVRSPEEGI